jgi:hypothetical protein
VPFLLTSSKGLGALAALAGIDIDDAHHGRLIGVPLPGFDGTVFEDLHGAADDAAFGALLRELAAEHFGLASRDFPAPVGGKEGPGRAQPAGLARKAAQILFRFRAPPDRRPGRQLDRVHEKMATLYAAGCLAIEFGILPWKHERIRDVLLSCTRGHVALVARDQAGAARRQAAPLDSLRQYVRENRSGFVDLRRGGIEDTSTHDHRACLGYVHQHQDHGLEYLFSDRRFEWVVGGAAARRLKEELAGRGLLATAAGAGSDRYSVRRTIGKGPDGKARREQVVAVRAAAFD